MPAALAREASNELRRSCACSMESDAEIAYRERKVARQQEQAAIRAEIRNAGKRKRKAETSSGAGVMLAGGVRGGKKRRLQQTSLMLLLFVLADLSTEVVTAFAVGQGRPVRFMLPAGQDSPEFRASVAAGVQQSYIDAPSDHRENMFEDAAYYGSVVRLLGAAKYVVEFLLFRWVVEQNCTKGIAPKNWQLLRAANGFIPRSAPAIIRDRLQWLTTSGGKDSDKWLASFRARWGAAQGKLEVGCEMAMQEMRNKAAFLIQPCFWVVLCWQSL